MRTTNCSFSRANRFAIAAAGLGCLSFGGTCLAQETVTLYGVIRDFKKTNNQFVVVPDGGFGHYAGNVSLALGGNGKPVFTGNGFKVSNQWKNSATKPIPPHLYLMGGNTGVISTGAAPVIGNDCTVDTFDASEGPYGGDNIGPAPAMAYPAEMPTITIPAALQSLTSQGNVTYNGNSTVSTNMHCNTVTVKGTLNVSGNVSILCDGQFAMNTNAKVSLNPGAKLTIYTLGAGSSWNHVTIGDPADYTRVHIYHAGTTSYMIHNHAEVYAVFVSPNAALDLNNHGELFGSFIGLGLNISNHGGIHIDGTPPANLCNINLNDSAGTKGGDSTGGIASSSSFNTWFTDSLGINLSATHGIELVKNADNIFEYLTDAFHPIDNMLYGNEGQDHNYYFTYAIDAQFVHDACANKFIEFQGNDDVWVFINGQLALDLGGVKPGTPQHLEIDRLTNLIDGETCSLLFFYAQRQTDASFNLRTNLDLVPTPTTVSVSAGCD